ncbi:MAG: hypothetical protein AAFQ79_04840 [Pseudomonadota bacterium]
MAGPLDLVSLLDLRDMADFVKAPGGYMALRRTDVAPLAYEVRVNSPPSAETLKKIMIFANGANPDFVRTLYESCNGMWVGATKFAVYGVIGSIDRGDTEVAMSTPWDINVPNIYGRPESWPDDALIVGIGTEYRSDGPSAKVHHSIEAGSRIRVSLDTDYDTILRSYTTVRDWITGEVARALADRDRW